MIQRRVFCAAGLAGAAVGLASPDASAETATSKSPSGNYVAQIFDTSLSQQEISRDFMIGSRCAWQASLPSPGHRTVDVTYRAVEVDGNEKALQSTLQALIADPSCLALSGTVGQKSARWVDEALDRQPVGSSPLIQIAPWLHDGHASRHSIRTFATLEQQIAHALKSLAFVGLKEVGMVFASEEDKRPLDPLLPKLAQMHQLRVRPYVAHQGLLELGAQLPSDAPVVMLFMGGTPELAQFSRGLGKRSRQSYAVGMADINSQTLQQLGLQRNVPVVITQVVPVVNASLPIVREYRAALSKFFDEPSSPLSLSGYLSARIAQKLLLVSGARSRAQVAQLTRQTWRLDLDGYIIDYDGNHVARPYVTQSMLTSDGRLIG